MAGGCAGMNILKVRTLLVQHWIIKCPYCIMIFAHVCYHKSLSMYNPQAKVFHTFLNKNALMQRNYC
jgi:hypothetical protein